MNRLAKVKVYSIRFAEYCISDTKERFLTVLI